MGNPIKKLFRSFNALNNFIYNLKTNAPIHKDNVATKEYVDDITTYDTIKSKLYVNPFKQWWMKNVYGKSYKILLDDLLFPRLAPTYENPSLGDIILKPKDTQIISFVGENKYIGFFNQRVIFDFHFSINDNDRNSSTAAYIKMVRRDLTEISFNAVTTSNKGIISADFVLDPTFRYYLCKRYNPATPKSDTYGDVSIPEDFTIPYDFVCDITDILLEQIYLTNSILISPLISSQGKPVYTQEYVKANFIFTNNIFIPANVSGIVDFLVPVSFLDAENIFNIVSNIYINNNTPIQFPKIITQELLNSWLTNYTNNLKIVVDGIEYYMYQYNFGTFDVPVKVVLSYHIQKSK